MKGIKFTTGEIQELEELVRYALEKVKDDSASEEQEYLIAIYESIKKKLEALND